MSGKRVGGGAVKGCHDSHWSPSFPGRVECPTFKRAIVARQGGTGNLCARSDCNKRASVEHDRGRDGDCSPHHAQTRTGPIRASGAYLEC